MKPATAAVRVALFVFLVTAQGTLSAAFIKIDGLADMVEYELIDSPQSFTLKLRGGDVNRTRSLPAFFPPSPNWHLDLGFALRNSAKDGDRVFIVGDVFHFEHPPGDSLAPGGQGGLFQFDFLITDGNPRPRNTSNLIQRHDAHRDEYKLSPGGRDPEFGPQIGAWFWSVTGEHQFRAIPEPATMLTGAAVLMFVLAAARARRRTT